MALTVLTVSHNKQIPKQGGGTYPGTELILQLPNGQVMQKGLHQKVLEVNKELATVVSALVAGDRIQLITEKSKDGRFNNVKGIVKAVEGEEIGGVETVTTASVSTSSGSSGGSNKVFKSYDNAGMQVGNALNVAGALLSGKKDASVETLESMAVEVLKLSNSLKTRLEAGEFDSKPSKSKFDDLDV